MRERRKAAVPGHAAALSARGGPDGYDWRLFNVKTRYTATIVKNGRIYADQGTTAIDASRYYLADASGRTGAGGSYTQDFTSQALGVTQSFSRTGQRRAHRAGIPPTARAVTVTVRWSRASDRFDVTGIALAPTRAAQSTGRAAKLRITVKQRSATALKLRITNLQPGQLRFAVRGRKVGRGAAVTTQIGV